jgi:hypothetical protein
MPQLASVGHAFADGRAVFLATDGRNRNATTLVEEVKGRIQAMGTRIVELTKAAVAEYDGAEVSEIEQALCQLSQVGPVNLRAFVYVLIISRRRDHVQYTASQSHRRTRSHKVVYTACQRSR